MTLILEKISKSYGDTPVLSDINITFEPGKSYALIGGSGSGKSTLLNIIGRLEPSNSGQLLLDGQDIGAIRERIFLRDYVGYVFQNYALIDHKTIAYNLQLVNKDKLAIRQMLDSVGLTGIDLGQKIYQLSGGQAQRVALARVLLKKFQIILADEPTGALDASNGQKVLDLLLEQSKQGKYLIIATHDPQVYQQVDEVINIEHIGGGRD